MAILKQEQFVLSPYAGSVVRYLLVTDENQDNRRIPLIQIITPQTIIRMNSGKLRNIISFIKKTLHKTSNAYLSRSINREFSGRLFAAEDRYQIFEYALVLFEGLLERSRIVYNGGNCDNVIIPPNPEPQGSSNFQVYFNPTINDTRRPLTFCRFINREEDMSDNILEIGSCGNLLRIPIHEKESPYSGLGKILLEWFENISNDLYSSKTGLIHKVATPEQCFLYSRMTDDGRLVINFESDFDLENSKVVTDNQDKTRFVLDTVIEYLKYL